MKKVILHLCADIGSDSYPYALDPAYQVILIGEHFIIDLKNAILSGEFDA